MNPETDRSLRRRRAALVEKVTESVVCTEECHQGCVDRLNQFDEEHPGVAFDAAGEPTAAEMTADRMAADLEGAF